MPVVLFPGREDASSWTAEECLEKALEDIRSGKFKASRLIILGSVSEGSQNVWDWYVAGANDLERLGMLVRFQKALTDDT